ncbi:uracil DNA glycosylase superfamily protein [Ascosphaera apis ARSEF 7405]|uniref:Uracil DNA glycosylase superfamily protein n=1 Tax=Ascosphaera apis ARSEF 7405 TaxID=392613 RepID=A0A166N3N0_9EURO|nr:uracil DNA glycosylase superfamily protein [Ascosphaera apis ARSEF 7405]
MTPSTFAGKLDLQSFASPSIQPANGEEHGDERGKGRDMENDGKDNDKGKAPVKNQNEQIPPYSSPTTRSMKRRLMMEDNDTSRSKTTIRKTQKLSSEQSADAEYLSNVAVSPLPPPRGGRGGRGRASRPPLEPTTISNFRDTISPSMILLFVGVNPGIQTGLTGHSYAHPSNLYWKLLHQSGITLHRHPPRDTYALPELYNIGNTNLVVRPTRDASSLTRAEMDEGARLVLRKIADARPEGVCFVGKGVWEAVWRVTHGAQIKREEFKYGWQDESENIGVCEDDGWDGSRVFVATTTSGLAAGMSPAEKLEVWMELGKWVKARRRDRMPLGTAGTAPLVE